MLFLFLRNKDGESWILGCDLLDFFYPCAIGRHGKSPKVHQDDRMGGGMTVKVRDYRWGCSRDGTSG